MLKDLALETAKRKNQTHLVQVMEAHFDRRIAENKVEQLYIVSRVAELLSIAEGFVLNLINAGRLRQLKLDAETTRVPASSITRYLSRLQNE